MTIPEPLLAAIRTVDGLRQRAGSRNGLELQGNLIWPRGFEEGTIVTAWDDTGPAPAQRPRCGCWLRPDVVWFEEPMPSRRPARRSGTARSATCFCPSARRPSSNPPPCCPSKPGKPARRSSRSIPSRCRSRRGPTLFCRASRARCCRSGFPRGSQRGLQLPRIPLRLPRRSGKRA